jgi:hypothetical protein
VSCVRNDVATSSTPTPPPMIEDPSPDAECKPAVVVTLRYHYNSASRPPESRIQGIESHAPLRRVGQRPQRHERHKRAERHTLMIIRSRSHMVFCHLKFKHRGLEALHKNTQFQYCLIFLLFFKGTCRSTHVIPKKVPKYELKTCSKFPVTGGAVP